MTMAFKITSTHSTCGCLVLIALAACLPSITNAFSLSSSFLGGSPQLAITTEHPSSSNTLTMRKQKASDRRTRRMQRGEEVDGLSSRTMTKSPMALAGWQHKKISTPSPERPRRHGRGRSRKRSNLYNTLSSYHGNFLNLLTAEYRAEVCCPSIVKIC